MYIFFLPPHPSGTVTGEKKSQTVEPSGWINYDELYCSTYGSETWPAYMYIGKEPVYRSMALDSFDEPHTEGAVRAYMSTTVCLAM